MPKITVHMAHTLDPATAWEKLQGAIEKTVTDFQGNNLQLTKTGDAADFSFKSMAFTIKGRAEVKESDASVEVDLPFAAMMYKDKAERAIQKNMSRALAS